MSAGAERRAHGQRLLDHLAADYANRSGVDRATMFGSTGLRVEGRLFAFVGTDGQLIVKVPAARAAALTATGKATPVRIGRHPAREWISIPLPASEEDRECWSALLSDAYSHVAPAPQ